MIFFVFIAVVLCIVCVIIWQILVVHDLYEVINVLWGLQLPKSDFFAHLRRYFETSIALFILFNSLLWAIKFSFLLFFRRLGKYVERQKLLWWPILAFTVVSYVVTVAFAANLCLGKSLSYVVQTCGTRSAFRKNRLTFIFCFAVDILTDLASKQYFLFLGAGKVFRCLI